MAIFKGSVLKPEKNLKSASIQAAVFMISFEEALRLVRDNLSPLPPQKVHLCEAIDHILAEDIRARVDVPGRDVSLKDGYAVRSEDVSRASPKNPVPLRLLAECFAGESPEHALVPGGCIRVTAGAPLPKGATAVLAEEFTSKEGQFVLAFADAPPGKNVLLKGADITAGRLLLSRGSLLSPTKVGALAAGGISEIKVYPRPKVLLLATGDEIVAPGEPLKPGHFFASNLVTLAAWCERFGFENETRIARDEENTLKNHLSEFKSSPFEVLITSGGAWRGPRDLILHVLHEAGWKKIFHRVRIGPGKAAAFGLLENKVVFCLPGGPPSNQMAFLTLALPGLFYLCGFEKGPFPTLPVRLKKALKGEKGWTQLFLGRLIKEDENFYFDPLPLKSRLSYLAEGEALVALPEGKEEIFAGEVLEARVLEPSALFEAVL